MIRIGFLYTRLRLEEKYLLEELEKHEDVEVVRINDQPLHGVRGPRARMKRLRKEYFPDESS